MSLKATIEIIKGLKDLKGHLDNIKKYNEAAQRATKGKNPFPADKKIEAEFTKLSNLEKQLGSLAHGGVAMPKDKKVGMKELADPKKRKKAEKTIKQNLKDRDDLIAQVEELLGRLPGIQKDAQARSEAARKISKDFENLVKAPIPDIGSVGKTSYFLWSQQFQRAAGALGSIATNAGKAEKKLKTNLAELKKDTKNAKSFFKALGVK